MVVLSAGDLGAVVMVAKEHWVKGKRRWTCACRRRGQRGAAAAGRRERGLGFLGCSEEEEGDE